MKKICYVSPPKSETYSCKQCNHYDGHHEEFTEPYDYCTNEVMNVNATANSVIQNYVRICLCATQNDYQK
jgi:hypothetical protein